MKDRVATHNTLHAALYTPDKHCTTGFKHTSAFPSSGSGLDLYFFKNFNSNPINQSGE